MGRLGKNFLNVNSRPGFFHRNIGQMLKVRDWKVAGILLEPHHGLSQEEKAGVALIDIGNYRFGHFQRWDNSAYPQ